MDYEKLKQEITDKVWEDVISLLKEIEPKEIASIIETVKSHYSQKFIEQDAEIEYLKNHIKLLEESMLWVAHDLRIDM